MTFNPAVSALHRFHEGRKNECISDATFEEDVARVLMGLCKVVLVKLPKKSYDFLNKMLASDELFDDARQSASLFHRRLEITKEFAVELTLLNGVDEYPRPFLSVSLLYTCDVGTPVKDMWVFGTELIETLPESIVFRPEMIDSDLECRLRFVVED